ncbi:class I SAM-dependent methyltransferase [Undibacterium sp.]|uniref:class I SAM-dependent DNA methyltransferase n=1 Tax=Undibacterium sp. TaxID=1914977 RepID=UPI002CAD1CFD|nr:class I SAM-dependent methyltransferase [Undibacterium sp.]HTD05787.1 class I SAM-dependent methyltransferase [Undibacterium sp.]
MDLTMYDDTYRAFCNLLNNDHARVLDAACGPGNVSRYLMAQRPELNLLGIDLAPRMVELARATVPSAQFRVHDCRRLADLNHRFDGIVCAFGFPYLSCMEVTDFISSANKVLDSAGVLYLSCMEGKSEDSGYEFSSSGDRIYVNYHSEDHIRSALESHGFAIAEFTRLSSPSNAVKRTTDIVVIARKLQ